VVAGHELCALHCLGAWCFCSPRAPLGPKEFGSSPWPPRSQRSPGALAPFGFGQAIVQRKVIERRHLRLGVLALRRHVRSLLWHSRGLSRVPLAGWFKEPELRPAAAGPRPAHHLRSHRDRAPPPSSAAPWPRQDGRSDDHRLGLRRSRMSGRTVARLWPLGPGAVATDASPSPPLPARSSPPSIGRGWSMIPGPWRSSRKFGGFSSAITLVTLVNVDQILIGALLGRLPARPLRLARRIFQNPDRRPCRSAQCRLVLAAVIAAERSRPAARAFLFATFLSALLSFLPRLRRSRRRRR